MHYMQQEESGTGTEFRLKKLAGLSMNEFDQFNRYFLFLDLPKMHYLLNYPDLAMQPEDE